MPARPELRERPGPVLGRFCLPPRGQIPFPQEKGSDPTSTPSRDPLRPQLKPVFKVELELPRNTQRTTSTPWPQALHADRRSQNERMLPRGQRARTGTTTVRVRNGQTQKAGQCGDAEIVVLQHHQISACHGILQLPLARREGSLFTQLQKGQGVLSVRTQPRQQGVTSLLPAGCVIQAYGVPDVHIGVANQLLVQITDQQGPIIRRRQIQRLPPFVSPCRSQQPCFIDHILFAAFPLGMPRNALQIGPLLLDERRKSIQYAITSTQNLER